MALVTLLIVAASVVGACIASVGLVRIYNERPIWNAKEATVRSSREEDPARLINET